MNKKGYTLIEMLAVIMILAVLVLIASYSYTKYIDRSRNKSFDIAVDSFKDALESAYADCEANLSNNTFCSNHSLLDVNTTQSDTVYLREIVPTYLEKIKNPYGNEEYCSETSSYIVVNRSTNNITYNGEIVGTEDNDITYDVCLVCGDKRSSGC